MSSRPKTIEDVLALPELCNGDECVVMNSQEMCEKYQLTVDFKLKIGHTVRIPKQQRFGLIGTDQKDILFVSDGEIVWQPVKVDDEWYRRRFHS